MESHVKALKKFLVNYQDIFNLRGHSYTQAMQKYPDARQHEFTTLLEFLDLESGDKLVDIPSGGCYLKNYLSQDISVFSVDDSEQFLGQSDLQNNDVINAPTKYCSDSTNTPFQNGFFDKAFSLAGSHHMPDKSAFFSEVSRILKTGGIFAYADVAAGSNVDSFLNVFVNDFNSMGHSGEFLDLSTTTQQLHAADFSNVTSRLMTYNWEFLSAADSVAFFKQLFGLDLANDQEVLNGILTYLPVKSDSNSFRVEWQLLQFKAVAE